MPPTALLALPTVVVLVSSGAPAGAQFGRQLRAGIESRLTTTARGATGSTDADLVFWQDVHLQEAAKASFEIALNTLRSEHNTARSALGAANPQQLNRMLAFRAIVICDVLEDSQHVIKQLETIATALQAAHAGQVALQLAAVLLHTGPTPAPLQGYSIRTRATTQAAGGALADPDEVREAAQHLVFTMLSAPGMWQNLEALGAESHWITFGSAAVILQHQKMQEYSYAAALKFATRHLAATPTAAELAHIRPSWSTLQDRSKWLLDAEQILETHGYRRSPGTPTETAPFTAPLPTKASASDFAVLSTASQAFAETAVTKYFETLENTIQSQLGSSRPFDDRAAGPISEAAMSRLPDGLPGLRTMLLETKSQLATALLLTDTESHDAPSRYLFSGAPFYRELAAATAEAIAARMLRLERIRRSMLHPLTQLLWLVPAAVCLRAMLLVLLPMPPLATIWAGSISAGRSTLNYWAAALVFCLTLGMSEAWYSAVAIANWRNRLHRETLLATGRQAVCVMNQMLWRAHAAVTRALDNTILAATHLTRLLNTELDLANEQIQAAQARPVKFFRTVHLVNFQQCDACIEEALKEIGHDQINSLSALLSQNFFPGLQSEAQQRTNGHWHFSRAFDQMCAHIRSVTEAKLVTNYLGLNALIIQNDHLNAGKIWSWLVNHANPLSPAGAHNKQSVWFVAADAALFAGADGGTECLEQLGYNTSDYQRLTSTLDCEIVCIRAFVDASTGEQRNVDSALLTTPRRATTR